MSNEQQVMVPGKGIAACIADSFIGPDGRHWAVLRNGHLSADVSLTNAFEHHANHFYLSRMRDETGDLPVRQRVRWFHVEENPKGCSIWEVFMESDSFRGYMRPIWAQAAPSIRTRLESRMGLAQAAG